jgi:hypothetical protein
MNSGVTGSVVPLPIAPITFAGDWGAGTIVTLVVISTEPRKNRTGA